MRSLSSLVAVTLLSCTLVSCVAAGGNDKTGRWTLVALGTDIKKSDISSKSWTADDVNNSRASKEIADSVLRLAKIKGGFELAKTGVNALQSVGNNAINNLK